MLNSDLFNSEGLGSESQNRSEELNDEKINSERDKNQVIGATAFQNSNNAKGEIEEETQKRIEEEIQKEIEEQKDLHDSGEDDTTRENTPHIVPESDPRNHERIEEKVTPGFKKAIWIAAASAVATALVFVGIAIGSRAGKKNSSNNDPNINPNPTPSAAETQRPEVEDLEEVSYVETGSVALANGEKITTYSRVGGYNPKYDPRVIMFNHQNEDGYENDDAYGLKIGGNTLAERVTNWAKDFRNSPEQIVRLRVQMGLEELDSKEKENARANELRDINKTPAEEYARIANETASEFYKRLEGGSVEASKDWTLEDFMEDENVGSHENAAVHGRYNGDDDSGEDADVLLTFYDAHGNNFVSSEQGLSNTKRDAGDETKDVGVTAWINVDEGGTWKWRIDDEHIIEVTPWGKEGDPHAGEDVDYSPEVDPGSEVTQEQNDNTNQGNQGYKDDGGATPGSSSEGGSSEVNETDQSGNASQADSAQSGNTAGGDNNSDADEESIVAGEDF